MAGSATRLSESGKLIARWREPDHPGFAAWLVTRLYERYCALALTRPALAAMPIRIAASAKGARKTKTRAARRHKEIAAALVEGQTVKAVQIEREKAGKKKAVSERTIRRVKRAKGL